MGRTTGITWTDHTWNPWHGCVKVSPGCKNCYAEATDARWCAEDPHWGPTTPRRFFGPAHWREPITWAKAARAAGELRTVFAMSMGDWCEDRPDLVAERDRLWGLVASTTDALIWLMLTKRPGNAARFVPWGPNGVTPAQYLAGVRRSEVGAAPWPNVWGGVTTEDQEYADVRLAEFLGTRAAPPSVRFSRVFASYEPALGPVRFTDGPVRDWLRPVDGLPALDWLIFGDESGHHRRPADIAWGRSARSEADAAGVAFHFKQWNGPDGPGIDGARGKDGKIHLPIIDGEVRDAGPARRSS